MIILEKQHFFIDPRGDMVISRMHCSWMLQNLICGCNCADQISGPLAKGQFSSMKQKIHLYFLDGT